MHYLRYARIKWFNSRGGKKMSRALGADFNNISERYIAKYDRLTHTWRIIDMQHPEAIKRKETDGEIPDGNPALTIIPELMFVELFQQATNEGLIHPLDGIQVEMKDSEALIDKMKSEISELKETNHKLLEEVKGTEGYRIKNKTLDILQKIAIAEDISSVK